LRESTSVDRFVVAGGRVVAAETAAGRLEAEEFVVAAGAWTPLLLRSLGLRVPIEAGRGYAMTISAPQQNLRRPTYLAEARIACTPYPTALRLAGTMEFSSIDDPPRPRRFKAISRGADHYLRGWRGGVESEWVGPRPVTPDGLPVIGRVGRFSNLVIAGGHAMLGLTLAPTTAVAVADLVCDGRSRYELAAFTPDRFN
jgi:D-amino-acid dehydrogenase